MIISQYPVSVAGVLKVIGQSELPLLPTPVNITDSFIIC